MNTKLPCFRDTYNLGGSGSSVPIEVPKHSVGSVIGAASSPHGLPLPFSFSLSNSVFHAQLLGAPETPPGPDAGPWLLAEGPERML